MTAKPEFDSLTTRRLCAGMPPLDARIEPWMQRLLEDQSKQLHQQVEQHGSPLNLLNTDPFQRNITNLTQVAADRDLDFEVYFARKANKCLSFVEQVKAIGCGIDTASEQELRQVLHAGVDRSKIICTAAIKSPALLQLCVENDVVIAIDNSDELAVLESITAELRLQARIALRVSGFEHDGTKLFSRFGFDIDEVHNIARHCATTEQEFSLRMVGIHFHLDGYCPRQRISAITQSLDLIDQLRTHGHEIEFLDIGGGIPMSYLESQSQWELFWKQHRAALLGRSEPVTYRNHGLGLSAFDGTIIGQPKLYPYYQSPVQAEWLSGILDAPSVVASMSICESIRDRNLQLRCEPGRSILDGCGMTIASVQYRKKHPNGYWLIGLSMNHTQCRTSSDDFLVDPILVRSVHNSPVSRQTVHGTGPGGDNECDDSANEGFLVGAYCTESELLCERRLRFPQGVNIGDLIVFPNTAGYLMHFLESRSHQFPLAKNVITDPTLSQFELDEIDLIP